jgi:chromosomal replication initiator protein
MIQYVAMPGLVSVYRPRLKRHDISKLIITATCAYYGVQFSQLKARNRKKDIVKARYMAMTLLRKLTSLPLKTIGALFETDHSMAIHGIKRFRELLDLEQELRYDMACIERAL